MANNKQQKKRILTNEKRRVRNLSVRTRMKTYVKKAEEAIASGDASNIDEALLKAISEIDKAAQKGVIHQKSASRKTSALQRRAGAASSSA